MLQKALASSVLPLRRAIREMHADITERQRTQHRIGNRMKQDVGIRMACKPHCGRDRNATDDQGAAWLDTVTIPALAHAQRRRTSFEHFRPDRAPSSLAPGKAAPAPCRSVL